MRGEYKVINRFVGDNYLALLCKTSEGYGLMGVGRSMKCFKTENSALEWLEGWLNGRKADFQFSFAPRQKYLGEYVRKLMEEGGDVQSVFSRLTAFHMKNRNKSL